jgi:predicted small lipoprotein YifL
MVKRLAALTLGLSLALGAACGRKGPLELPPGRAPMPVEKLTAVPKDGTVLLAWANPIKTVAGKPLGPLGAVEIWVQATGEKASRLVRRIEVQGTSVSSFTFEPGPGASKSLAFTVRVFDRKGRASDFSPAVPVEIARPPAPGDLAEGGRP